MKTLSGIISSLKTDQTAVVTVGRRSLHPLYKKIVKKTKKYACHYQDMKLELGQKVMIQECRPMSKTKKFKIIK